MVVERKRANAGVLKSGVVNPDRVSADSPIPFNVRSYGMRCTGGLNATFPDASADKHTKENALVEDIGDFNLRAATI